MGYEGVPTCTCLGGAAAGARARACMPGPLAGGACCRCKLPCGGLRPPAPADWLAARPGDWGRLAPGTAWPAPGPAGLWAGDWGGLAPAPADWAGLAPVPCDWGWPALESGTSDCCVEPSASTTEAPPTPGPAGGAAASHCTRGEPAAVAGVLSAATRCCSAVNSGTSEPTDLPPSLAASAAGRPCPGESVIP